MTLWQLLAVGAGVPLLLLADKDGLRVDKINNNSGKQLSAAKCLAFGARLSMREPNEID